MKVLHVIAEMGSGGAEALVEELARELPVRGVAVAVASAGGRREPALEAAGVHVARVPLARRHPWGVARAALALADAARRWRPDVVHAHNVGATVTSRLATAGRSRPPVLTTFHGVAAGDYRRAAQMLDRCADAVVVVAPEIGARLRAAGLSRPPLHVVANAVSPPRLVPRGHARAALGLPDDVPVVLCPARLVPQKRHDIVLEALARTRAPAQLLVAGAGDPAHVLRDVERLGLAERVHVLGDRDDVPLLLSAADAVLLASDWEGMPIALLEAMAAGRPVVATDVDGVRRAVGDEAARLVPPRRPAELAAALDEVLGSADLREHMGAAGQRRAAERTSPAAVAAAYRDVYDALLTGRAVGSVRP